MGSLPVRHAKSMSSSGGVALIAFPRGRGLAYYWFPAARSIRCPLKRADTPVVQTDFARRRKGSVRLEVGVIPDCRSQRVSRTILAGFAGLNGYPLASRPICRCFPCRPNSCRPGTARVSLAQHFRKNLKSTNLARLWETPRCVKVT
jgi:hypothetical protein